MMKIPDSRAIRANRAAALIIATSVVVFAVAAFAFWPEHGPYVPLNVSVNLGDRLKVESIDASAMSALSHALYRYPMVNQITVYWRYAIQPDTDYFTITYNRTWHTLDCNSEKIREQPLSVNLPIWGAVIEDAIHKVAKSGGDDSGLMAYGAYSGNKA
jgi:hypothetical protein